MMEERDTIGIIGLGRMGGNLALQALEKGFSVYGYDNAGATNDLLAAGLKNCLSFQELKDSLPHPRIVFIYVIAGPIVEAIIQEAAAVFDPGDIILDGGNSYWGDSLRRYRMLKERGINFIDCGTSGGVEGARHGACFMVGGEPESVERVEPILKSLAVPGGYVHAGPPAAGHFTKLVHNGIEFGMLQAIGEGVDLLEKYRDKLNIPGILENWNHGSVIRSWLIELMGRAYNEKGGFEHVPSHVEDTGEVNWLVNDAMQMEVPIPVIAQSVMQLIASRDQDKTWAKAVAMMRNGFGNHPFGPNEYIASYRSYSRIGDFPRDL
ncbi:phosphogluconate dehydrogenase (NAD(+)-dependent, decarboxylating) [Pontibacter beigongshangensis]|uniref:phosphogluconate dehydrogenase (NAD(+)-dependent, decarboxylating) n=1 Tax=Pontibacter beigongshangensis TaxID=2574733 RepID=UPI0016503DE2|nr:decarboxylating 6-phosphogluconate dehydrogenase [Pontibacter beigongshangensis]